MLLMKLGYPEYKLGQPNFTFYPVYVIISNNIKDPDFIIGFGFINLLLNFISNNILFIIRN